MVEKEIESSLCLVLLLDVQPSCQLDCVWYIACFIPQSAPLQAVQLTLPVAIFYCRARQGEAGGEDRQGWVSEVTACRL